jgi:hypothetical protein
LIGPVSEEFSTMSMMTHNKYRAAIDALQRGRELVVDELAEEILERWADTMIEEGPTFHEFVESQGTRLHFLSLMVSQLEQSAQAYEESLVADYLPTPEIPKKTRKTRAKKLSGAEIPDPKREDI